MLRLLVLTCCLFVFLPHQGRAQELPREITIAADLWCPYTCEPGKRNGILIDVAKAIFEPLGVTVRYRFLPWAQARDETLKGLHFAIAGAFEEDAVGFVLPEKPVLFGSNGFFALTSSDWRYQGIDSLNSIALGVTADYSYGAEMDAYFERNRTNVRIQAASGADALRKNLKKLMEKKVDVVLDEPRVIHYEWTTMGNSSKAIKKVGEYGHEGIWIAFSPKRTESPQLAAAFSKGFTALEASGDLKRLIEHYLDEDLH